MFDAGENFVGMVDGDGPWDICEEEKFGRALSHWKICTRSFGSVLVATAAWRNCRVFSAVGDEGEEETRSYDIWHRYS